MDSVKKSRKILGIGAQDLVVVDRFLTTHTRRETGVVEVINDPA